MQTGTGIHKTKGEDYVNIRKKGQSIASIFQTDEGGRFFQIRHQYEIIFLDDLTARYLTEKNGIWVSLGELEKLCRQSKVTTNELRTCVSLILSFA